MDEPEQYLSDLLYSYGSLYAPQIVLVATLSAITIFRREISCNHIYAGDEDDGAHEEGNERSGGDDDNRRHHSSQALSDEEAEEILHQAGMVSSLPLLPLILSIADWFRLNYSTVSPPALPAPSDSEESKEAEEDRVASLLRVKQNVSTSDLLELAGNYYCGTPMTSLLLGKPVRVPTCRPLLADDAAYESIDNDNAVVECEKHGTYDDLLGLPADTWVHIMSFLAARDAVSVGSCNRACRDWVDKGETANRLWKTLWRRDFCWIVQLWDVGRRAAARSGVDSERQSFDKQAYFRFGLCWLDYVLAGCNSMDECLVGIGGHVYDVSLFLLSHPGSPETVMVHAGQDATDFFYRIGHSRGARKLAQSMCVVVDQSRLRDGDGVFEGLGPTRYTRLAAAGENAGCPAPQPIEPPEENSMNRHAASRPTPTLLAVKTAFERQRAEYQAKALRRFSLHHPTVSSSLTHPKVYYDPLVQRWKAWYTDSNLESVFWDVEAR